MRRYAPRTGALRGYRFALRALRGSWLAALGLFLFWFLTGSLVVGAGFALTWVMPGVSPPAIVLLLLIQFAVLWLRSAVRVACWGSYIGFLEPRARGALASTARVRLTVAGREPPPERLDGGPGHDALDALPRIRSLRVAKEKRTQASSPNASPGTAATWASASSLSQKAADPPLPCAVEARDVREGVEGALRQRRSGCPARPARPSTISFRRVS